MKSTKQQLLRSPNVQPTSDVIAEALGEANKAYVRFLEELPSHDIHLEWGYYKDGKAWLGKGFYKWIGIRGGQKQMIADSKKMGNKLNYLPLAFELSSAGMLATVYTLIDLKKSI